MCRFARSTLREQLKRHYNLRQYKVSVALEDLSSFDAQLADKLTRLPAEYLLLVSSLLTSHFGSHSI